jgi:hypothetical protein
MRYLVLRMSSWLLNAVWAIAPVALPGQTATVYASPDGTLQAVVVTSLAGESTTSIQRSPNRVLLTRDERSNDGAHGHGVLHASWTADSQFFVASTAATGGHQPWARPLWFYFRTKNRIIDLGKYGATATGDFTLRNPDIIETTVAACSGGDRPQTLAISLHRLVVIGRLPVASCANKQSNSPNPDRRAHRTRAVPGCACYNQS